MTGDAFTYRAFISYSHGDHGWGAWLHRELEKFRTPKEVAGGRKLGRCFRDEAEMGAAAHLPEKIEKALKASEWLVVVCSPKSAASQWVNKEIADFKALGREHRVLALVVEGKPGGSRAEDAPAKERECFPDALRVNADGGMAEPLAVDVRKFGRADAVVRLVAEIIGVDYDTLRQREVRRRRWAMMRVQGLVTGGILLTTMAATSGYFAAENYVRGEEERSARFARESIALADAGRHPEALLMALEGDPAAGGGWMEGLLRPGGYQRTLDALASAYTHNAVLYRNDDPLTYAYVLGHDGDALIVAQQDAEGMISVFNASTHEVLTEPFFVDGPLLAAGRQGERGAILIVDDLDGVTVHDATTGERRFRPFSDNPGTPHLSRDASTLVIAGNEDIWVWNITGAEPVLISEWAKPMEKRLQAVSPDGAQVALGSATGTAIHASDGGEWISNLDWPLGEITSVDFSADGAFVAGSTSNGTVHVFLTSSGRSALQLGSVELDTREDVAGVALSPAGDTLAVQLDDNSVSIVSIEWGRVIERHRGSALKLEMGYLPDGTLYQANSGLTVWRVAEARAGEKSGLDDLLARFSLESYPPEAANATGGVLLPAFDTLKADVRLAGITGDLYFVRHIAATGEIVGFDDTGALWRWDGDGRQLETRPFLIDDGMIREHAIAISPDASHVLVSREGAPAVLRSIAADGGERVLYQGNDVANEAVFSPDGAWLAAAFRNAGLKVWRLGGEAPAEVDINAGVFGAVAFSQDSALLAAGGGELMVWSTRDWKMVGEATVGAEPERLNLRFVPGGYVLGNDYRTLRLWRATGGPAMQSFVLPSEHVRELGLTEDGRAVQARFQGYRQIPWDMTWGIDPVLSAPPKEKIRLACGALWRSGVLDFSSKDFQSFAVLDRNAPHPCREVWGFDPRKGEAAPTSVNGSPGR